MPATTTSSRGGGKGRTSGAAATRGRTTATKSRTSKLPPIEVNNKVSSRSKGAAVTPETAADTAPVHENDMYNEYDLDGRRIEVIPTTKWGIFWKKVDDGWKKTLPYKKLHESAERWKAWSNERKERKR